MFLSDALLLTLRRAKLHWCWCKGEQYWTAETLHERILVDHEIYHDVLKETLAGKGIEMKTWSEYMKPAEDAWNRQCAVENELRSNIDFWKQVQGVQISTLDSEM